MKIIQFPGSTSASDTATAPPVDERMQLFQARCFEAFVNYFASRGMTREYAEQCLRVVRDLLRTKGKSLAAVKAPDYEAWNADLAYTRKLQINTRRTYQKGVRQFFGYIVNRTDIQNDCLRDFGSRIELVAHGDNSILHVVEDETEGRRPPLSHDEIEQFFRAIDLAIDVAELERPRAARGLKRDYAVIYTGYIYGLRVSELADLRPDDWRPTPELPELGRYGQLHVRSGKGARGSGKRSRIVPTTHPGYPEFLQWYLTDVRPLYKADARDDDPLFFTERGTLLSASSIEKSFKSLIIAAGLDPKKFTPHSLRRSMCQHEMMRGPTEMVRAKAGHQSTKTTLIYGQVPPEHYRDHQRRLIRTQLKDIAERNKGD